MTRLTLSELVVLGELMVKIIQSHPANYVEVYEEGGLALDSHWQTTPEEHAILDRLIKGEADAPYTSPS